MFQGIRVFGGFEYIYIYEQKETDRQIDIVFVSSVGPTGFRFFRPRFGARELDIMGPGLGFRV